MKYLIRNCFNSITAEKAVLRGMLKSKEDSNLILPKQCEELKVGEILKYITFYSISCA